MNMDRRSFLKFLGKSGALISMAAAAPKTAFGMMAEKEVPKPVVGVDPGGPELSRVVMFGNPGSKDDWVKHHYMTTTEVIDRREQYHKAMFEAVAKKRDEYILASIFGGKP